MDPPQRSIWRCALHHHGMLAILFESLLPDVLNDHAVFQMAFKYTLFNERQGFCLAPFQKATPQHCSTDKIARDGFTPGFHL